MLDIGEDTGALVVYVPEDLAGQEIEIRPQGGVWTGVHTAVRTRHMGIRVVHAGVFGSLAAGSYDLRLRPGGRHRRPPAPPLAATFDDGHHGGPDGRGGRWSCDRGRILRLTGGSSGRDQDAGLSPSEPGTETVHRRGVVVMAVAVVNGIEIAYEVHGEGEPIVLVCGTGQRAESWGFLGMVNEPVDQGTR